MHRYLNPTEGTTMSASGDKVRITHTEGEGIATAKKLQSAGIERLPRVLDIQGGMVVSEDEAVDRACSVPSVDALWGHLVDGVRVLQELKRLGLHHGEVHEAVVAGDGLRFPLPLLTQPAFVNEKTDLEGLGVVLQAVVGTALIPANYPVELCFLIKKLTEQNEADRPTLTQVLNYHAVKQRMPKDATRHPPRVIITHDTQQAALQEREEAVSKREAVAELRETKITAFLQLYQMTAEQLDSIPTAEEPQKLQLFADYYGISPKECQQRVSNLEADTKATTPSRVSEPPRDTCSRELSFHTDPATLISSIETQAGYGTQPERSPSHLLPTPTHPLQSEREQLQSTYTDDFTHPSPSCSSPPYTSPPCTTATYTMQESPLPSPRDNSQPACPQLSPRKSSPPSAATPKPSPTHTGTSATTYTQDFTTESSPQRYSVPTEETYYPTPQTQTTYTQGWSPSRGSLPTPLPTPGVRKELLLSPGQESVPSLAVAESPREGDTPQATGVAETPRTPQTPPARELGTFIDGVMMSPQEPLPEICTPGVSPTPKLGTPRTHEEMIAWHLQRSPEKYGTPEKSGSSALGQCRITEDGVVVKPWQQRSIKESLEEKMLVLESMVQRNSEGRRRKASIDKHEGMVTLTPARSPGSTPKASSVRCTSTGRLFATPSTSYYSSRVYTPPKGGAPRSSSIGQRVSPSPSPRRTQSPSLQSMPPPAVPLLNSMLRLPDDEDPTTLLKRLRAEKRSMNRQGKTA